MVDKTLLDAIQQIKTVVHSDPSEVYVAVKIHGRNSLAEAESFVRNLTDEIKHDHYSTTYWCKGELDHIEFTAYYDEAEIRERYEFETYQRLKAKFEPMPEPEKNQPNADDEAAKDFELLEAARQSAPVGGDW